MIVHVLALPGSVTIMVGSKVLYELPTTNSELRIPYSLFSLFLIPLSNSTASLLSHCLCLSSWLLFIYSLFSAVFLMEGEGVEAVTSRKTATLPSINAAGTLATVPVV